MYSDDEFAILSSESEGEAATAAAAVADDNSSASASNGSLPVLTRDRTSASGSSSTVLSEPVELLTDTRTNTNDVIEFAIRSLRQSATAAPSKLPPLPVQRLAKLVTVNSVSSDHTTASTSVEADRDRDNAPRKEPEKNRLATNLSVDTAIADAGDSTRQSEGSLPPLFAYPQVAKSGDTAVADAAPTVSPASKVTTTSASATPATTTTSSKASSGEMQFGGARQFDVFCSTSARQSKTISGHC
jgi:hypothetical protein